MTHAATLLRRARASQGISQRELARRAGLPQSTIGRIETGIIDPRSSTLERALKALGYEISVGERPGQRGIDRGLIRRFLELSPRERIEYAVAGGRAMHQLRRAVTGPARDV